MENDSTDFDLSYVNANSDLIGNGVLPVSMASQRRSQAYTIYDQTTNHLDMAILNGSHMVSDNYLLSGVAYWRGNTTTTFNGDVNDDYEDATDDQELIIRLAQSSTLMVFSTINLFRRKAFY